MITSIKGRGAVLSLLYFTGCTSISYTDRQIEYSGHTFLDSLRVLVAVSERVSQEKSRVLGSTWTEKRYITRFYIVRSDSPSIITPLRAGSSEGYPTFDHQGGEILLGNYSLLDVAADRSIPLPHFQAPPVQAEYNRDHPLVTYYRISAGPSPGNHIVSCEDYYSSDLEARRFFRFDRTSGAFTPLTAGSDSRPLLAVGAVGASIWGDFLVDSLHLAHKPLLPAGASRAGPEVIITLPEKFGGVGIRYVHTWKDAALFFNGAWLLPLPAAAPFSWTRSQDNPENDSLFHGRTASFDYQTNTLTLKRIGATDDSATFDFSGYVK